MPVGKLLRMRKACVVALVLLAVGVAGCRRDRNKKKGAIVREPEGRYALTDLGTLGGREGVWLALNDAGDVAGTIRREDGTSAAAVWRTGAWATVGTLGGKNSFAADISAVGVVVGQSELADGASVGFVSSDGRTRALGRGAVDATGINAGGAICGTAAVGESRRAMVWEGERVVELGTLGGSESHATGINAGGWVVGYSTAGNGETRAFVWRDGRMSALAALGGSSGFSQARAINRQGWVVGESRVDAVRPHAVLWRDGGAIDLGTLDDARPAGRSVANAVNDRGQVVGRATRDRDFYRAFLWEKGAMVDLNDVIAPSSGWTLTAAYDVNEKGQVVGEGRMGGEARYFLLTPRE